MTVVTKMGWNLEHPRPAMGPSGYKVLHDRACPGMGAVRQESADYVPMGNLSGGGFAMSLFGLPADTNIAAT
ncbi:MAG: hypothetical protein WAM30_08295 [Candidatus Dormiibacterota bacterium]